jgi:hypothetical protein
MGRTPVSPRRTQRTPVSPPRRTQRTPVSPRRTQPGGPLSYMGRTAGMGERRNGETAKRRNGETAKRRNGETAQPSTQPGGPLFYMGSTQRTQRTDDPWGTAKRHSLQRSPEGPFFTWGGRRERSPEGPFHNMGRTLRTPVSPRRTQRTPVSPRRTQRTPVSPRRTQRGIGERFDCGLRISDCGMNGKRQPGVALVRRDRG